MIRSVATFAQVLAAQVNIPKFTRGNGAGEGRLCSSPASRAGWIFRRPDMCCANDCIIRRNLESIDAAVGGYFVV